MNDLPWMTLAEAAGAIAARKLSPVELMTALLERIGRLDPKLNVFIRLDGEAAMAEARAAEAEIVSGRCADPCMACQSASKTSSMSRVYPRLAIRRSALFLTFPTRGLTGQQVISSERKGASKVLSSDGSTGFSPARPATTQV
jgi:hypothetical protein